MADINTKFKVVWRVKTVVEQIVVTVPSVPAAAHVPALSHDHDHHSGHCAKSAQLNFLTNTTINISKPFNAV